MTTAVTPPDPSAGLDAWLSYLERLHHKPIELGLDRIKRVAERLQLTTTDAKVITVAGTNGKGSTVRYLETILRAAGYQTGVYISPHLQRYEERVRVAGAELDETRHVDAFAAIEAARGEVSLTYFEFGTLAAFWLLQQHQLDVWILEVGLGGRLDAVNIIDADVGVLTSVGIDHIGFLGPDRTGIAREKAGIFRPGRPAVCGEPDFPEVVRNELQQRGIELLRVGFDFDYGMTETGDWFWRDQDKELSALPLPQLPLPNAATTLAALQQLPLPVSREAIDKGLREAREPGRLQLLQGEPDTLLDVAHNPHAARYLASYIRTRYPQRPVYAVVGMLNDKDIAGTLTELTGTVKRWYFADLHEPRGARAAELQQAVAGDLSAKQFNTVTDAYQAACQQALAEQDTGAGHRPLVLVCGSFYTVGKIPAVREQ
ncbi:bifunctional tetrahydrofolate synthase/dihydrofolate synthase [Pseudidiomarina sp.]|uniref:bifunctional tetrahydrofolate synthase/dihydrofolate synthase n=1 Tax=Pseudidiomarina sp. TaxID=2081707 RepID=UPI00299EA009|nr:bifunctional tetrahydrofolate synthase/dihydrofolate synthase [Pseudidiomarina sp.]MDX1705863.1 bifunctional tetrahydrofolate synthase/dihydrofolate synthase [Pseudidiomarina sp.]